MASLVWVLSLLSTLALSAAAVSSSSSSWLPTSSVDCDSVVMDMMDCLPYVTKGSNQSHPDKDCCEGVSSVVKLSPVCLCAALEEAIRMGIDVDMKRAAGIPKACSIEVSVGNCGAPPPNVPGPAPSPKLTPPPPKTPTPSPAPPTPPKSPPTPPPPSKPTPPPPCRSPPPKPPFLADRCHRCLLSHHHPQPPDRVHLLLPVGSSLFPYRKPTMPCCWRRRLRLLLHRLCALPC